MGLLDMLGIGQQQQQGAPQSIAVPRQGIGSILGIDGFSPTFQAGLQMLSNSMPSTQPTNLFQNVPEAIGNAQVLQQRRQAAEQDATDRQQADAAKAALSAALKEQLPANLHSLADANPEQALALWKSMQGAAVSPVEINGQLVDPTTGQVIGDYRDPAAAPNAPSGYQWTGSGQLAPIPGGPADLATQTANKPPTEAELRSAGLYTVVSPDAALLLGDGSAEKPGIYDQLANGGDQAWNAGAFGINPMSWASSPEYRQAKDAVASIAQSYLYSTSGASAPEGEAARIADSVTPKPFDSPQQLADKKRRLETMVLAIQQKQGNAGPSATSSGDGWEVIGVQ